MDTDKFTVRATLVDTSREDFIEFVDRGGKRAVYKVTMEGDVDIAHYGAPRATGDTWYCESEPERAKSHLKDVIGAYLQSKGHFPESYTITHEAPKRKTLPSVRKGKELNYIKSAR